MADWTEKYRPTTLREVRGNDKARDQLREWAQTWDDHGEAVIVHGSPGVGKTSAAHALAADMGWPVMELNASDSRTADTIERFAGRAAMNTTLGGDAGTGGRQLLVIDEADNFHGTADYGGAREITRLVKKARQPMVLLANDYYEMSNALRNACREIEFRDVSKRSIVPVLRDICRKEGIEYEESALEAIAATTDGDLRSAINDLQAIAEETDRLMEADVVTGERDRTEGIFEFMDAVFKEAGAEAALRASYDVDETPDDLINWIEDNVPKDYAGAELADAYDFLANADRWLGRVRTTQNYTYWRYATDNMAAGVAAARTEPKGGWTRYGPPSYWSKLGRSKGTRDTRDGIARRIAEQSGCSVGTARRDVLPFLAAMIHHCKPRDLTVAVAAAYDLDESEVAFVTGSGESTNKVESVVEDARQRREETAVEHSGGAFAGGGSDSTAPAEEDDADAEGPDDGDKDDGGQATLAASAATDDENDPEENGGDAEAPADPEERAETVGDDENQSGLDDFV